MEKCDLSILMLNNNEPLTEEDKNLLTNLKNKKHIVLVNKMDLESKIDFSKLPKDYLKVSIIEEKGIEELKNKIMELFNLGELESKDLTYLSDARSISLLKKSLKFYYLGLA